MIVDIHTHTFPDKIAAATLDKLKHLSHTVPFSDGTAAGLAASMARAGVDRSVVMPVATSARQVPHVNDASARMNERGEETGVLSFGCMHPKDSTPVSSPRSFIRAEASFTWGTCRALVATGMTTERSTPARAMEAARPAAVPSEKGTVWDRCLSLSRVAAAILSGKVWVWMSTIMAKAPFWFSPLSYHKPPRFGRSIWGGDWKNCAAPPPFRGGGAGVGITAALRPAPGSGPPAPCGDSRRRSPPPASRPACG